MKAVPAQRGSNARKPELTSRERVMAAMRRLPVDRVPCAACLNSVSDQQALGFRYEFPWGSFGREQLEYLGEQLGMDVVISLPIHHYFPESGVTAKAWLDGNLVHKVYRTPAGELRACIDYKKSLWLYGADIPFYNDFGACYVEPWLKSPADLECLKHIFLPPRTRTHRESIQRSCAESMALARRFKLPTIVTLGMGLTGALQMCGPTHFARMVKELPELIDGWLELEHKVCAQNIALAMDLGVDIVRRNGSLYLTPDSFEPELVRRFQSKRLRRELDLVHASGKVMGYNIHDVTRMLAPLEELPFDGIMNVDIGSDHQALAALNGARDKSFWIGPSLTAHMTATDSASARHGVRELFKTLGKTGLLLMAYPCAHSHGPWRNTLAMLEEWKKSRSPET